jgi:lysozyme family protein
MNVGKQKVQTLQGKIRVSTLGTVYKESEQALLDKYVSDPTSFFNKLTTLPQLKNLMEDNQRAIDTTAKHLGITPIHEPIPGSQKFNPDAIIAKSKAILQKDPNNQTALKALELANKKKGHK